MEIVDVGDVHGSGHDTVTVVETTDKEAGGVPDLVGETLVALDPLLVEPHVLATGADGRGPCPHRVGAMVLDHHQRVHGVALGLVHARAVGGLHGAGDDHVGERGCA